MKQSIATLVFASIMYLSTASFAVVYKWEEESRDRTCQEIKYLELDARGIPTITLSFDWTQINPAPIYYKYSNSSVDNVKSVYSSVLAAKLSGTPVCVLGDAGEITNSTIKNRQFYAASFH